MTNDITIYLLAIIAFLCIVIVVVFLKMKKQKNVLQSHQTNDEHLKKKQDVVVENMTQEMFDLTQNLIKSHNIEMNTTQYAILNSASNLRELLKIKSNKIEIFYEVFGLSHMLDDIAANMAPHFKNQETELVFNVGDNVPMSLSTDVVHLSRIINNILEFSIFSTTKGLVTLKIWTSEHKSILNLEITDNSQGLKTEELHKMLNLIHDESTGEHAGLALYIAKELSNQIGGRLEVNSKIGTGNTFLVAVPIEKATGEYRESKKLFDSKIEKKNVLIFSKKMETGLGLKRLLSVFYPQITLIDSRDINSHKVNFLDYDILILDIAYFNEKNNEYLNVIKKKKSISIVSFSSLFSPVKLLENVVDKHIVTPMTRVRVSQLIANIEDKKENDSQPSEIVSQYNGSLSVYTEKIEETPDITPASFTIFEGAKLLIVEDNLINQKILLGVLKASGIKIDIANNGQEAVDFLIDEKRIYDLVLMDISMPVMDGETATKQIRQVNYLDGLPIVAFTAFALGKEIEQMFLAGVNAYLTKPLNVKKLYTVFYKFLGEVKRDVDTGEQEKIEGLDIAKGITWADENEALYKETLKEFVSAYKETADSIPKWITNKQYEHVKMVCRDMQSALTPIGAYELKDMVDEIQKQFVYNKEEFLQTYVDSYPKVLNKLIKNINKYLES